jgi:CyaY protein
LPNDCCWRWSKTAIASTLAAKAGGFHYRYDAAQGAWLDTKGAGEFFANLSRYATEQSGLALQFSAG